MQTKNFILSSILPDFKLKYNGAWHVLIVSLDITPKSLSTILKNTGINKAGVTIHKDLTLFR